MWLEKGSKCLRREEAAILVTTVEGWGIDFDAQCRNRIVMLPVVWQGIRVLGFQNKTSVARVCILSAYTLVPYIRK